MLQRSSACSNRVYYPHLDFFRIFYTPFSTPQKSEVFIHQPHEYPLYTLLLAAFFTRKRYTSFPEAISKTSFFEKQKTFFNPQGGVTPSFRIYIGKDLLPLWGGSKSFPPSILLRMPGDGPWGAAMLPRCPPSPRAALGGVQLGGLPRGIWGRGFFSNFFDSVSF